MAEDRPVLMSGGCQCGAVRYALYAAPHGSHICHCRMCQKAFGAFYAPLTLIDHADFAWTRGQPAIFKSSPDIDRGFCAACGTPLTFAHRGAAYLNISIGSLDHPEQVKPEIQIGIESRMPWAAELPGLKEETTEQVIAPERLARVISHQHPDHDTAAWPVNP
ncbi:MAG: GFA family protein [Pseudomonadota bacterium]